MLGNLRSNNHPECTIPSFSPLLNVANMLYVADAVN